MTTESGGGSRLPEISVVVPLEDPRASGADAVRSWADQTCDPDAYEIVIASDGTRPEWEDVMRAELRPHDRIVRSAATHEIGLMHDGAVAAHAPWVIITEFHVRADRNCIAEAIAFVRRDGRYAGASFAFRSINLTPAASLEETHVDTVLAEIARRAPWNRVRLRGTLLKRSAYIDAGGLDERFGLFAEPVLSANLDALGHELGTIDSARVSHLNTTTVRAYLDHAADYTSGECLFRELGGEICDRYVGALPAPPSFRPDERGRAARALIGTLLASARSPRLALAAAARAMDVDPHTRLAVESVRLGTLRSVASGPPVPKKVRELSYFKAHAQQVRVSRLRWDAKTIGGDLDVIPHGLTPIDRVPRTAIGGMHTVEHSNGLRLRWTDPVSTVRLATSDAPRWLTLHAAGLRGDGVDYVRAAFVDGRRVPNSRWIVRPRALSLPVEASTDHGHHVVTISATPIRTPREDRRRLAIPLAAIELSETPPR